MPNASFSFSLRFYGEVWNLTNFTATLLAIPKLFLHSPFASDTTRSMLSMWIGNLLKSFAQTNKKKSLGFLAWLIDSMRGDHVQPPDAWDHQGLTILNRTNTKYLFELVDFSVDFLLKCLFEKSSTASICRNFRLAQVVRDFMYEFQWLVLTIDGMTRCRVILTGTDRAIMLPAEKTLIIRVESTSALMNVECATRWRCHPILLVLARKEHADTAAYSFEIPKDPFLSFCLRKMTWTGCRPTWYDIMIPIGTYKKQIWWGT